MYLKRDHRDDCPGGDHAAGAGPISSLMGGVPQDSLQRAIAITVCTTEEVTVQCGHRLTPREPARSPNKIRRTEGRA